ncbi:unnamed protein product [Rhizophagus irregularis]|nr:unnamed protein product [Rhizophagus irregularis]
MFNFRLLLLLQILTIVKSQLLTPNVRTLHSSILVDKKLYIFSGFKDFVPNVTIESVTASYGGANNDTIYFINNEKDKTLPPVLTFNTKDNSWNSYSQQIISGERPIGRNQMRPITDYSGKIFLLAGFPFTTLQDTAISRVEYSATLLPNGIIVYMGGKEPAGKPATDGFRVVYLYNTNDNTWKPQPTFGDSIPNGDNGISSVLGLDGFRIIVFGGDDIDNKMLYVLDTTNFNWYEPNVSGKGPTIKRFDSYCQCSGFGLNFNYRKNGESDVLLLDIGNSSNYIWTNNFDPNAVIPPQSSSTSDSTQSDNNSNNKNNTGIIVGVVVGVLGIIIITSLSIFFFIKRRKNLLHEKATSDG